VTGLQKKEQRFFSTACIDIFKHNYYLPPSSVRVFNPVITATGGNLKLLLLILLKVRLDFTIRLLGEDIISYSSLQLEEKLKGLLIELKPLKGGQKL
jgi:hypothetical protein